jgi:hypothetical protein
VTLDRAIGDIKESVVKVHYQTKQTISPILRVDNLINILSDDTLMKNIGWDRGQYGLNVEDIYQHDILIFGGKIDYPMHPDIGTVTIPRESIRVNPTIMSEVTKFLEEIRYKHNTNTDEYICCHVRRGDKTKKNIAEKFSDEMYFCYLDLIIKEESEPLPIVLCTENFETIEHFKARYGENRIFHYPVTGFGYKSYVYIRNAMIDFVLMSKAKCILMDGLSMMSLTASHYGTKVKKVVKLAHHLREFNIIQMNQGTS